MEDWFGILLYAVIIAAMVWYGIWNNKREKGKKDGMPARVKSSTVIDDFEPSYSSPTTRTLLLLVLRRLNLEYQVDQDKDILFTYQGEHFLVTAQDDCKYIEIRDLWWYDAPLDDIENLSYVHKAVNECNIAGSVTVVYSYKTDDNTINLHTLNTVLWIPEIPEIESYFTCALDHTLRSHQRFFQIMEGIRREQYANTNN